MARSDRKTKEPVVHWGSGPELLAIRTHWKESVPNLEIFVVKRNANGSLHLDQDPRDLQGKTLLCVLFEPHRQHYSLLQIKNQLQLLPFLMQVHQQSGGAQASRDAARAMPSAPKASSDVLAMDSEPTRASPIKLKRISLASILEQQKIKALAEAPAKSTRSQLKRKVDEAELESPLSTKSFFAKKREKPAREDNHPKRAKQMGLFGSVREEASEDKEDSSEAIHSRKRARRRGP